MSRKPAIAAAVLAATWLAAPAPAGEPAAGAVAGDLKQALEDDWAAWISFAERGGLAVDLTHLIAHRCAIKAVRYGIGDGEPRHQLVIPPCDWTEPEGVAPETTIYRQLPPSAGKMTVQLTYADGTRSEVRTFTVPR